METALTILMVILAVAVIASVLLQSGRSAGISGAIGGGAEAIFGKKKGWDNFLSRLTAVAAALFLLTGVIIAALQR